MKKKDDDGGLESSTSGEGRRDDALEFRLNTLIPGIGRKAHLDRIKNEYPDLLDSKPGVVIGKPTYINRKYAQNSQEAMEKIRAQNALVFKKLDKIIDSVRAASSSGTKAKVEAEAEGGYVLNQDLGEPSSKYQNI